MEKFKVSFTISGKDEFEKREIAKRDVKEMLSQLKNDWYTHGAKIRILAINKMRNVRKHDKKNK